MGILQGLRHLCSAGPCLVRSDIIGDPKKLQLKTVVDGEVRQEELVEDLL